MAQRKNKPATKPAAALKGKTVKNYVDRINDFLAPHSIIIAAGIFVLTLALSAVYFIQAKDSPVVSFHKWPNSDMAFFDTWAKDIAAGDWWGNDALHPYHDWHEDFAMEYFNQFPDVAAKYNYMPGDSIQSDKSKRALINDIYKDKTFHQEPLYAYMLAFTYKLFSNDHIWVYFWQFLLAAFTNVLVYFIGRRLFGSLTGLLAALFVTLCGSIMVYEMVLLRTTLTNFFTVALLLSYLRFLDKPESKRIILFGAISGFALLAQSYFLLFILPALIWFAWLKRKEQKTVITGTGIFLATVAIVMLPLFIRNVKVGAPVVSAAGHGAMAYIPMNVQQSYPMESFYIHMPTLARIRYESGGNMISTVFASLKTFDSPGAFWNLYKQKIGGLFMWYEIPNNINYYLYSEIAPVLKSLPVRYFFIAPLGIVGLLFGIWKLRWKIIPFVLMTIASVLPLFIAGNLARYRTPLVILMCVFAAYLLVQICLLLFDKKTKQLLAAITLVIISFFYTSRIVDKNQFIYFSSDLDSFFRYHYLPKMITAEDAGDFQKYLEHTTEMMVNLPDYFFTVKENQPIIRGNEAESSRQVANMMESHHNILKYLNRAKEVAFYQERITTLRNRINNFEERVRNK